MLSQRRRAVTMAISGGCTKVLAMGLDAILGRRLKRRLAMRFNQVKESRVVLSSNEDGYLFRPVFHYEW